jgi:hypothetical protein
MEKITLTFKQTDLQIIANALSQRPFAEVHELITDIQKQLAEKDAQKDSEQHN